MQSQQIDAWGRAYPMVKALEGSGRFRLFKQRNKLIDLPAQQLGVLYQLGDFEKAYSTHNNSVARKLCISLPCGVIVCGMLTVTSRFFQVYNAVSFMLPMLILVTAIGLLVMLGIGTLCFPFSLHNEWILVYTDGLLQILTRSKTIQSMRWTAVEQILKNLKVQHGARSPRSDLLNCSICAYDGTIIKVAHEYAGRFELAQHVDEMLVDRLLPEAIHAYTTRSAVYFGDIFIDMQGLSYKGGSKFIAWQDVQQLAFEPSGMTVYVNSFSTSVFLDLHRRPNVCVLEGLLKYIQQQSGLHLI